MARHITPSQLREHLIKSGVVVSYEQGWDSAKIDPYGEDFRPVGVVLHHTAGVSSLAFCMRGTYPPVRNCQFLVDRDGTIHLLAGAGCYHAGLGGPMTVNKVRVPKDQGNKFFYGIEIESLGTESHVDAKRNDRNGFTPEQVKAVSYLTASLTRLLDSDESCVIRHRDWAPGRKSDVLQPIEYWRKQIAKDLPAVDEKLHPFVSKGLWDGVVPSYTDIRVNQKNSTDSVAGYRVAARLYDLGFYLGEEPRVPHAYPRRAVRSFKQAKRIGLTGGYTLETHKALFGKDAS